MAIKTDLNVAPYFDDYEITDNYYRVLFRPGVAVQVRELNQVQSIMQNQIEQFADQIYKNGTIISGTVFQFYPDYSYVKIKDIDTDEASVRASDLVDYYVRDSNNLVGIITNAVDGFESKTPDLNTLYVRYINGGNSKTETQFGASAILTVYQEDYPLETVQVINGGLGFSNNDTVQIVPALQVNATTGTFANGEQIIQTVNGVHSNLVIIGIDSVPGATSTTEKILRVRPVLADLSNTFVTASKWTFDANVTIRNASNTATGTITSIVGTGARALVVTDGAGTVANVVFSDKGEGYSTAPYITIRTTTSVGVQNLELQARNFYKRITTAASAENPVGRGYGFGVTEGTIYMNGTFVNVNPQVTVVTKYTNVPDQLVVGFQLEEAVVNSSIDSTLLDNALGTLNFTAPGADRLKITPVLDVREREAALANTDDSFFILCEFDNGQPSKQYRKTQYSGLEEAMAKRHDDITGDYVLDQFGVFTKDKSVANSTHFNLVVDPGVAYIKGKEVSTYYNTNLPVQRGTATETKTNTVGSANYGNYLRITRTWGIPQLSPDTLLYLKSTATGSNTYTTLDAAVTSSTAGGAGATGAAAGRAVAIQGGSSTTDLVGTARVRAVVKPSEDGNPFGQILKVYLYDVQLATGKTLADVKGINGYESGALSTPVIAADAVLVEDGTLGANVAKLEDTGTLNRLIFDTGYKGVKQANTVTYTYMKQVANVTYYANGTIILPALSGGETYPFADGQLSATQKAQITVTADGDMRSISHATQAAITNNNTSTIRYTRASLGVLGDPGNHVPGELLEIANYGDNGVTAASVFTIPARVANSNDTHIWFDVTQADGSFPATTSAHDWIRRRIGAGQQVALNVVGRSITISGSGTQMQIDAPILPSTANAAENSTTATIVMPVTVSNVTPVTKVVNRDVFVKLQMNTHPVGTTGPWSLGIPDAFRLKKVYKSANISTVNTNSEDVTSSFMVDMGQRANYYGLSRLVKLPRSNVSIGADDALLVQFDCFTADEGVYTADSYPIQDTANLTSSTTTINTLEIPEFIDPQTKEYYDLRDCIDFRPRIANTVVVTQDDSLANINPSSTETLVSGTKKYPMPDINFTYNVQYYLGHADSVQLDDMGNFTLIKGQDSVSKVSPPNIVEGALKITTLIVPPYPSLPTVPSNTAVEFMEKRAGTGVAIADYRRQLFTVSVPSTEVVAQYQPRRYTMEDIGQLERRVQALEYYTSLNIMESNILNNPIPSGVSPSINRFKMGWIVDDFDSTAAADTTHPEFNSEIIAENSELEAPKNPVTINLKFNIYDTETASGLINRHGFTEDGQILTSANAVANSDASRNHSIMLPYQEYKVIGVEKKNATTPKIVPKNQFGGSLSVTPAVFDIATRVKNYKRQ